MSEITRVESEIKEHMKQIEILKQKKKIADEEQKLRDIQNGKQSSGLFKIFD